MNRPDSAPSPAEPRRWPPLGTLKTYVELAAFGLAAIFLLGKVISGQYNDGMEVRLIPERCRLSATGDIIALEVQLARNGVGRIQVRDVLVEYSEGSNTGEVPRTFREPMRIRERSHNGHVLSATPEKNKDTFLPPGDATQLGYLIPASHGSPVILDVTILARRTRLRIGNPQWRASTVVLPVNRGCIESSSTS
jgi:hypothetical protein